MIPGNGIETTNLTFIYYLKINFQINDSRQRDWNNAWVKLSIKIAAFKLMIPGNGIETPI